MVLRQIADLPHCTAILSYRNQWTITTLKDLPFKPDAIQLLTLAFSSQASRLFLRSLRLIESNVFWISMYQNSTLLTLPILLVTLFTSLISLVKLEHLCRKPSCFTITSLSTFGWLITPSLNISSGFFSTTGVRRIILLLRHLPPSPHLCSCMTVDVNQSPGSRSLSGSALNSWR